MNELIGKGRPFYSALDMGAKALKRKVGTGSEFLKELMALPGVKPTELKERGLESLMNEPKMTHEQFLGHLSQKSNPRIIDKTIMPVTDSEIIDDLIYQEAREEAQYLMGRRGRRNADEYDETVDDIAQDLANNQWNRFSQIAESMRRNGEIEKGAAHEELTLPGGENYREMLIKYPMGNFEGVSNHFHGEPNILASMRLKDRTGPNGEKLLHLEELQSDWHQQGREKGYRTEEIEKRRKELSDLAAPYIQNNKAIPKEIHDELLSLPNNFAPPDAPFKKNWEEMAIKRLMHHAAEKGYHGIVMTPGEEQNKRYSLAKHIQDLHLSGSNLVAYDKNGNEVIKQTGVREEDLPELVGKELAEKLMQQKPQGTLRSLTGQDIEIKGKPMKAFYNKKVPNIFNQLGKKHGVKMELHGHTLPGDPSERGDASERLGVAHVPMANMNPQEQAQFNAMLDKANEKKLHHFPITEPMRKDILTNGLPLYKTGGVVHKATGGNVQPSIEEMRMALQRNRLMVPKAEIQSIGANEAPNLSDKIYVEPGRDGNPSVGGVDMDKMTPGMQYVQQSAPQMTPPNQQQQPQQPPQQGGQMPQGAPQSNILSMTPQGQALSALGPQNQTMPNMAKGGSAKKPTVAEMKEAIFQKAQEGLMRPSEVLGKHEGKYLHITEADRAKVEKRKHGMRGGVGFSQIGLEDPDYAGRVWGVGKSGTAIKLLNREKRGLSPEDKAIWSTFIGTPEMHTSNQLVFNRMWNKFQEARKNGLLSPEQEAMMLDMMRSAMTKGTEKSPSKPVFDSDVSFDNTHHLFDTFERRRILADLMAGKKIGGKKAQIFDASKMIEDTTDPRLLHAPSMSVGPHVFSFSGETSYEPELNKAFPFMLHGETSPEAFRQIPFEMAAPDFVKEIQETKGRAPGYMDIVRRIPRQQLTEKYLTALQKKGYKKGGKASQDTMTLELMKKPKKAKK